MEKYLRLLCFAPFFLPQATAAQHYCNEPRQPYCLTAYGTFEDEWSFESCKSEMDTWQTEVVAYGSCLKEWIDDTVDEATSSQAAAVDDYQDGVTYWNCMAADPNGYCGSP